MYVETEQRSNLHRCRPTSSAANDSIVKAPADCLYTGDDEKEYTGVKSA